MVAFIEPELTSIAFCWRVERRDGVALGCTSHDRDLLIDGLVYRASPGMLPSAVSLSDGFEASALDVSGALTSDAITEADLAAGRWDGAAVFLFMVDWEEPGAEELPLARGELGDISLTGQGFTAELKGMTAALDRPVVEQTSPECRAELGDARCRVDMAGRVRIARIAAIVGEETFELSEAGADRAYAYGRLRWITGNNSGLESPVLTSAGARLTLREPPPQQARIGDLVEMAEGCDRAFATCTGRFANALNFRGEPHLPGIDLLTRYAAG
ncbi:MAG TPA: DUF2163 domain-containing protein [Allosphingosinicella sp.]|uniref:DUF2163 domain-containing protein n=1 Tax=Allosphingosinicella sp. TaxID=2823234 RepID=UPI002F27C107